MFSGYLNIFNFQKVLLVTRKGDAIECEFVDFTSH